MRIRWVNRFLGGTLHSSEAEDARARMAQSTVVAPTHDATEDCAEFDVGPVIEVLRRAQAAARSVAEARPWIGVGGARLN